MRLQENIKNRKMMHHDDTAGHGHNHEHDGCCCGHEHDHEPVSYTHLDVYKRQEL